MATFADPEGPEQTQGPIPPTPPANPIQDSQAETPSQQKEVGFVPPGDTGKRTPPDPSKDPYGYLIYVMEEGFGSVHARLNQQGKLVADMAERVYGPQAEGGAVSEPRKGLEGFFNADTINKFLDLAKAQFSQVDPRDQRALEIGYKILNGAEDTALKTIYRSVGRETASNVTHIG